MNHIRTARRKLRHAARCAVRHLPHGLPPLLYLTDPDRSPDPLATAAKLPPGSGVIYRHFGAPERQQMARALADLSTRRDLVLLIGGDPELARAIGADGVHWPEARGAEARHWAGAFGLQTVSAHSHAALARAAWAGVDAALVSTVFASASPSAGPALGATRFRQMARRAGLPVYALGGITAHTARRISHVAGLAGIRGLDTVY
jgi:thiamine-phosphate pyrophosphorylase